ncbi:hypothetical protein [Ekhidna sp.]|uniref:hypothetical protein n=1 Tax=Ekhidna sp. TaxID=2608089 RepID=UPI0032968F38
MKVQYELIKYLWRKSVQFKILSEGFSNKPILFKSIPFKSKERAKRVLNFVSDGEVLILINTRKTGRFFFEVRLYGKPPLGRSIEYDSIEELLDAISALKDAGIFSDKIRIGYKIHSHNKPKVGKLPWLDNFSIDHFDGPKEEVKGDGAGGRPKRNRL